MLITLILNIGVISLFVNMKATTSHCIDENYTELSKLHFYFKNFQLDSDASLKNSTQFFCNEEQNKYNNISDITELQAAINHINTFYESQNEEEFPLFMTVEFSNDFSSTPEYKEFLKEADCINTIDDLRSFRKKLNISSKKYHNCENQKNLALLNDFSSSNIRIVNYAPFVIIGTSAENIDVNKLTNLIKNDKINNVSFYTEKNPKKNAKWKDTLEDISAYDIVSNKTYTGEGVKIGILEAEGICNKYSINLLSVKDQIKTQSGYTIKSDHATNVTTIIAKMVPDAEYYITYTKSGEQFTGVEWFIDNECDVINYSGGFNSTCYQYQYDGLIDYQVRVHFLTFVNSAGNISASDYNSSYIVSPGYAHNAITVGGVSRNSISTGSGLEYNSGASYKSLMPLSKPEISAIFEVRLPNKMSNITGTSYSAPQVTGAIAMLIEKYPSYGTRQQLIKALLMSTATKTDDYIESVLHMDERVGAGVLNVEKLLNTSTTYLSLQPSYPDSIVKTTEIHLDKGDELQAALAWDAWIYYVDTDQFSQGTYTTDFKLQLYNENDELVCESDFINNTVEFFRYVATESGTYLLTIYQDGVEPGPVESTYISWSYSIS